MSHFITICRSCGATVSQCRCASPNKEKRYVDHCSQCPKEKKAFKLQGHTEHQGIPIAIENQKGSARSGVDKDGKPWRVVMKFPYGYIKGSKGADGEEVDCYVGPHKDAPHAYVIHQNKHDGKTYDEDKVMLGFKDKDHAEKSYLAHYNDSKFLGPIHKVTIERLKEMIDSGKKLVKISSVSASAFLDELTRIHAGEENNAAL